MKDSKNIADSSLPINKIYSSSKVVHIKKNKLQINFIIIDEKGK